MNKQMAAVMRRRGELLAKIAMQREQVADVSARWQVPLTLADRGLAVVHFLRSHPVLTACVVALFAVRRRGMVVVMKSGWRVWKGYRFLATLLEKLPRG